MKDPETIDCAARLTYHVLLVIILSGMGLLLMQCVP